MGAMQVAKLLAELGAGERALSAPAPAATLTSLACLRRMAAQRCQLPATSNALPMCRPGRNRDDGF